MGRSWDPCGAFIMFNLIMFNYALTSVLIYTLNETQMITLHADICRSCNSGEWQCTTYYNTGYIILTRVAFYIIRFHWTLFGWIMFIFVLMAGCKEWSQRSLSKELCGEFVWYNIGSVYKEKTLSGQMLPLISFSDADGLFSSIHCEEMIVALWTLNMLYL